jgi:anti-sigma28 factor (negative regulator of flagellin synthesis)
MATLPIGGPGNQQPLDDALRRTSTDRTQESGGTGDRQKVESGEHGAKAPAAESTEKVQISQKARDLLRMSELMNAARNSLDKTPDVRAERIAEVKERLRSGVYDTEGIRQELAHRLSGILGEIPSDKDSGTV